MCGACTHVIERSGPETAVHDENGRAVLDGYSGRSIAGRRGQR